MATCQEDSPMSEKTVFTEFVSYARQIDFTVHPDLETEKRVIRIFNGFAEILEQDELIVVGSAADGSKVNIPEDSGDIDVLLVSKCVLLDQSLFEYSEKYPAFLYVRGTGQHEKYFRNEKLIDGKYIPVSVLKSLRSRFYGFVKLFVNKSTVPGVCRQSGLLSMIRNSAVGIEKMQLDTEPLQSLDLTAEYPDNLISRLVCPMINTIVDLCQSEGNLPLDQDNDDNQKQMERSDIIKTFNRLTDLVGKGKSKDPESFSCTNNSSKTEECNFEVTKAENKFSESVSDSKVVHKEHACDSAWCFVKETRTVSDSQGQTQEIKQNEKINIFSDTKDSGAKRCFYSTIHDETQNNGNSKGKSLKFNEIHSKKVNSVDFVTAFSIKGWPIVAEEWLTRTRKWPSDETIRSVRQAGCHIVAKRPLLPDMNGDPKNEDHSPEHDTHDPYFRISFSVCELVLSKSLSEPQLLCWRVLKAIQKAYLGSEPRVLASYHWKNVAFWLFEETDPNFWTEESVLEGVCRALDFMIMFMSIKFVPYYFVRRCNLIDGCRNDLIHEICKRIIEIRNNPLAYLKRFIDCPPVPELYKVNEDEVGYTLSKENVSRHIDTMADCMSLTFRRFPKSEEDRKRFRSGIQNIMKTMEEIISESNDPDSPEVSNFYNFKQYLNKLNETDSSSVLIDDFTDKFSEIARIGMTEDKKPFLENFVRNFKDLVADNKPREEQFKIIGNLFSSFVAMAPSLSSEGYQAENVQLVDIDLD